MRRARAAVPYVITFVVIFLLTWAAVLIVRHW